MHSQEDKTHGFDVPYPDGRVVRGGRQAHAVRGPCDVRKPFCVAIQVAYQISSKWGPYFDQVVGGCGQIQSRGRIRVSRGTYRTTREASHQD